MLNLCSFSFLQKQRYRGDVISGTQFLPDLSLHHSLHNLSDQKQVTENNITSTNPS